jgi:hypothetical protein
MALITGNTYPVRVELAQLGGVWNKTLKGWNVPDEMAAEAQAIVDNAPASAPRSRSRYGRSARSTLTRFSSGAEIYTNVRGRCIDAPCCGCCS